MIDDINLIYETYHLPKIEKEGLTIILDFASSGTPLIEN
jgi:hypothetical protein